MPKKNHSCFKTDYSKFYDLFYQGKDYAKEVKYIDSILKKYKSKIIRDVACGTGNHLIELIKLGYKVDGSDISSDMIEILKHKTRDLNLKCKTEVCSMTDIKSSVKYDAALCMFAAINYLSGWREIDKFFKTLNKILKPGALLIFDFWNGLLVPENHNKRGKKTVVSDNMKITRETYTVVDKLNQNCAVHYNVSVMSGKKIVNKFNETHNLHYFSPEEIEILLVNNNFNILSIQPFGKNKKISSNDWELVITAQKK
ncbi:MAG TPA: class I SAM-dependent methyltransferase [bacterium]|nr:class I SAM-dependent methyltransferase [bacterium]HPN30786.1 class I SAM-dependent methyltransferase [bacterium]